MSIKFSRDSKANILDFSPADLKAQFGEMGLEPYRADQVLDWVYRKGVYDFEKMTNLPVNVRESLAAILEIKLPVTDLSEKSSSDKSVKLLLKLNEKEYVECVMMPVEDRTTVCVSSQVGCKFHCAFCASGQDGFFRNLTQAEIIAQVLLARDLSPNKKITNIVFMGIGEPFDNYQNLLKTIRTLNSKQALGLGARKITISTCGIVPKIEKLSEEGLQVELSISLHGANDSVRGAIMPVNKAYPVRQLMDACKKYAKKTSRAITFEYILIDNVNASAKDAYDLVKQLKGMLCKVNLIPYNPIEEFPHDQPKYPAIVQFQKILQQSGIKTTVRFSKGRDITAACGQLRSVRENKLKTFQKPLPTPSVSAQKRRSRG